MGDAAFQYKCIQKMRDEATVAGKTVLYVSHNMNTIRQLCDRCVVLDHGHLVYDGEVENGIRHYIGISGVNYKQQYSLIMNKRPKTKVTGTMQLISIHILDTIINIYTEGEGIHVRIEYDSLLKSDRIKFMFIYFLLDDTRIAMTESRFFHCNIGKNSVEILAPTDCLINEEYKVQISLLEYNENGVDVRHDCANEAFYFKIHTKESGSRADCWRPATWGLMREKPIIIL